MSGVADPLRSKALLVGVSSYGELPPLPAVANNLTDLGAALRDPDKWGLPADHCVELPDPRDPVDVVEALDRLAREPLDTLLVYFAGHGLVDPEDGQLILAAGRTTPQLPRFTGLGYASVRDLLRPRRAKRLLVVLDCCFSGRAAGVMADPSSVIVGQLDISGAYVLTSAGATQTSRAPEGARHTAFTGGLLEVIGRGVPNGRPFLTPGDLFEYTQKIMADHGWPQPSQSHENTIRELQLMRNPWSGALRWLSRRHRPTARAEAPASDLVVGIHVAVSAVRPTLGPCGPDSLTALEAALDKADRRWLPGMRLVHDVMTAMRRDHGDGAATAAIVVGELLSGIHEAVRSGAPWEEIVDRAEEEAAAILRLLSGPDEDGKETSMSDLGLAVTTALGNTPQGARVLAAVDRVGAHHVEIATGTRVASAAQPELSFVRRLTLDTTVLVPNSAARPLTLHEPYVLIAPDGTIPADELQGIGWRTPAPLLIIADRVDAFAVGSLHSLFSESVVVVRPTGPDTDWATLSARADQDLLHGRPLGRADRALVTSTAITVTWPPTEAPDDSERGRVYAGPVGTPAHATAVRALAVARSAARSGVLPGGGIGLHRAGRELGADAGLFSAALSAPLRQLIRNAGQDADAVLARLDAVPTAGVSGFDCADGALKDLRAAGVVDGVATVRGVVEKAATMISRYVAAL
ncbi:caspase family protein [Streptomyces sp. W16]|uniref:caspase, EACC1-associated type n=1 Tax=Streptomyces sp. W16 TaxID=3076631 RepID=UPI00295B3B8D|nr:caspase family protein [Streptomyces sp. W16]MDV9173845.1 caspase family protein [Streptomyces sp. W16]